MWGGDIVCQKLGYGAATVTAQSGNIADEAAFFVGDCYYGTFPDCSDQWSTCAGGDAMTTVIECDGSPVPNNEASCILPTETPTEATTQPPVTESPVEATTEEPTTASEEPTTATTSDPTVTPDYGDLPSSVAPPADCVSLNWAPVGFEDHVSYCHADGVVYLNGRSTCILSSTDNIEATLQNSWENDWYLSATTDCSGKDYDAATTDQLWITNEMCNNLEDDIDTLETSVSGLNTYMDEWTQSVIELVNSQINNFDAQTQEELNNYLATLT